jgi:probable rRNA maturation factor
MTRKRRARAAPRRWVSPAVDIVVASPLWTAKRSVKTLLRRAIGQAARLTSTAVGELAIVLTDDAAIRALNRHWRCKDKATNVLSFRAAHATPAHGTSRLLGDIVIAYETTEREARAENKPFAHHAAHLAVHGFLHLAGYDHAVQDEAAAMERLETAILARLDVPNPYVARNAI